MALSAIAIENYRSVRGLALSAEQLSIFVGANGVDKSVPVGPHLADQLLLPMALAGGGAFLTQHPTAHSRTNVEIIEKFLPVSFDLVEDAKDRWRISIEA